MSVISMVLPGPAPNKGDSLPLSWSTEEETKLGVGGGWTSCQRPLLNKDFGGDPGLQPQHSVPCLSGPSLGLTNLW